MVKIIDFCCGERRRKGGMRGAGKGKREREREGWKGVLKVSFTCISFPF